MSAELVHGVAGDDSGAPLESGEVVSTDTTDVTATADVTDVGELTVVASNDTARGDDDSGDGTLTSAPTQQMPKMHHLASLGLGTVAWVLGGAATGAAMSAAGLPHGLSTWFALVAIILGTTGLAGSAVAIGSAGTWVPGWRASVCAAGMTAAGLAGAMTGEVTTGFALAAPVVALVACLIGASSAQHQQQRIIEHAERGVRTPHQPAASLINAAVSAVVIGVGGWMWSDAFSSPRIGGVSGTAALVGAVGVASLAAWLGPVGVASVAAGSRRGGSDAAVARARTWTQAWWPLAAGGLAVSLAGSVIVSWGDGRMAGIAVLMSVAFVDAVGVNGQYAGGARAHTPALRHGWMTSVTVAIVVLAWAALPIELAQVTPKPPPAANTNAPVGAPLPTQPAVTATTLPADYVPQTPSPLAPAELDPGASVPVSRFGAAFDGCVTVTDYLGQRDCYIEYFDDILTETGSIDTMLDSVAEVHADPAGVLFKDHCHEVLHTLAEQAVEGSDDPLAVLGHVRTYCTGGFAHGAMVTYMTEYGIDTLTEQRLTFCDTTMAELVKRDISDDESTGWLRWNCDHMLGHALFLAQDAAGTVAEGAALCKIFPNDKASWKDCMAGYFMEYFVQLTRSETDLDRPVTGNDVFALCRKVDPAVAQGCYSESGALAVAFSRGAFVDAYELGEFVPDEHLDVFYESIGRMVTVYNSFDIQDMQDTCTSLPEVEMTDRCLIAISGAMIMELQQPDMAAETCLMVSETNRVECDSRTTSVAGQLESSGIIGFGA